MPDRSRPLKILHIVGRMNRGGVETWLMNLLRTVSRDSWQMDFLAGDPTPADYDEEIRQRGARILPCPLQNPLLYVFRLVGILRKGGPYDVIHSHVHHFSGITLLIAYWMGIPVRIAHSHSDTAALDAKATWLRRLYLSLMKKLIDRFATVGMAVSREAATALSNGNTPRLTWQVRHCGINLADYSHPVDREALRQEWGIPRTSFVIGHVGSFSLVKNHEFILQVAQEVFRRKPDSRLVLVGDGRLRSDIEHQAKILGIADKTVFTGKRADVPNLMGMMDVFLFPSLYEGLGLAVIEAQSAGLPIVIADSVPKETEVVSELFVWMSLSQPPELWAEKCLQMVGIKDNLDHLKPRRILEESSFNIATNWHDLDRFYTGRSA